MHWKCEFKNDVEKAKVPNYKNLLAGRSGQWLVDTIRAHTHQYLAREKAYFARFENSDLEKLKPIQDRLDGLIQQNKQPDSCLLRVGAGVGFHSITGDWQEQSQDHFSQWNHTKGYLKNKTRKFDFEQTNEGIDFSLMGFIKLTLQTPESATAREQKLILAKQQAKAKQVADAEAEARRLEQERVTAEEAKTAKENERRKPFEGKLRKGTPIYAEVMTVSGAKATLKLLALGQENEHLPLIYNGLVVGQLIQVEVKDISGKGKVMAVGFKSL